MCNNGKIYGNFCAVVGDRHPNMENNVGIWEKYGEFRQQSEKQFLFSIHELTVFLVFLSTVVSFN